MSVTLKELLTSARNKLINAPSITPLLGADIGQDPVGGAFSDGWIFLGHDDWEAPERDPANTGKAAVVLSVRNHWTSPNRHNTLRFPLLRVHILADMSRPNDVRLSAIKDAEDRCDRIAIAVSSVFHDVLNIDHVWPNDVFVISSVKYTDLAIVDVNNKDGLVSGDMSFALELD